MNVAPMQYGVVTDDAIWLEFGGIATSPIDTKSIKTLFDLFELAHQLGVRQLWIVPESKIYKTLTRFNKRLFKGPTHGWNYAPKELKNLITGWRDGSGKKQIIFPGAVKRTFGLDESSWAIDEITDARELFEAVRWLYLNTGVLPSIPIRTAKLIVESQANEKLRPLAGDFEPFQLCDPTDLIYLRQPTDSERKNKYVHAFDKNAMYLSASNIPLGDGEYEVVTTDVYVKRIPGLWCANILNRDVLPELFTAAQPVRLCDRQHANVRESLCCTGDRKPHSGCTWYYTPTLALAIELGAHVQIRGGLIFPKQKRHLEKFYTKIKAGLDQRAQLSGAELIAANSLKFIYTRFFGWLNHHPGERVEPYYRPDWRAQIIAEAKARLLRNIFQVENATGLTPFAINRDTLIYFSDEGDPLKALPYPLTGVHPDRGTAAVYKHIYSFKAKEVIKRISQDKSLSAAQLDRELKSKWRAK